MDVFDRVQPYLLLHGGAGPSSFAGFGELLATHGRTRVIVPTHPGFDGTPRPSSLRSVRDLASWYTALLDERDMRDVTIIGNSVGGWIAAELALLGSPRVTGVILVNAVGVEVPSQPVTDVSGLQPAELRALSFHDPSRFAHLPGPAPANLTALFAYAGGTMTDPTLLDRLGKLDLPVRVIWGAADRIVTPSYGLALAAAIPGASFTVLSGAGHLPQVEAPASLVDEILRHPHQPLGVTLDRQADVLEAGVQEVAAVTVVGRYLGQHAVGEPVGGADDRGG